MRSFKYLSLAMGALLLTTLAGLAWLLGTNSGARTALQLLDRFTPLQVSAEDLQGRLGGDLALGQLRLQWPGGQLQAGRLRLNWRPARLLAGQLDILELQLAAVELQLPAAAAAKSEPQPPLEILWPQLQGWPVGFGASLGRLQVDQFQLRRGEDPPQLYPRLELAARWQQGVLELADFNAQTPYGQFSGGLKVGLVDPLLKAELQAFWPELGSLMDGAKLSLELDPQADRDHLLGRMELTTLKGTAERAQLQTRFQLGPKEVQLAPLELRRSGAPDQVTGQLAAQLAEQPPTLALDLQIEKLNLGPETGYRSNLSGTITVTGRPESYQGKVDLHNRGEGWREHALAATVSGTLKGLQLTDLRGRFMRGELRGDAELNWSKGFGVQAKLQGRGLDPAQITPDWPGLLNFRVEGSFGVGSGQPMAIDLRGRFLESTLRGRALQGVVDGVWRGTELTLRQLELQGEGIDLSASGQLSRRIDFHLNVPRLGGVIPTAAGRLESQGWLRWSPGQAAGELSLQGADLSYGEQGLAKLEIKASQPAVELPMSLQLVGQGAYHGAYRLDRTRMQLDGSPQQHRLSLDLLWPQGSASLGAKGGYAEGIWSGLLEELSLTDSQAGDWRLAEGVELTAGARQLRLAALKLLGSQGEELQVQGDLQFEPLQGEFSGQWQRFDLSHLQPWLGALRLSGRSSGLLGVQWRRDGSRELHATLDLSGRIANGELAVGLKRVEGELDWSDAGLLGLWDVNLDGGGVITGRVASTDPMSTGLPRGGDFYLDWTELNLQWLQPLLPDWTLAGGSQGDLSGRWWDDGRLELRGEAAASGKLVQGEQALELQRTTLEFDWGASGLASTFNLQLADGGTLMGEISSTEPAQQAFPSRGSFALDWAKLDLELLQPWLPEGLRLSGALQGDLKGNWLPEGRLTLAGNSSIQQGHLEWRDEEGVVVAPLRTADFNWSWQQESLSGNLDLVLTDYGRLAGSFALPLPARFPVALEPQGPIRLDLNANLREKGLLTAVLPGLVQESRGQLEVDLHATGSWQQPQFSGRLQLKEAGAYLHAAGTQLRDLELLAHLEGNEILLERFGVRAGKGHLGGEGRLKLDNWTLAGYSGKLRGENFLAVNLPELQLHLSPDLSISGDLDKLQVRGDVTVPEMLIQGRQTPSPVRPSADVVVVDAAAPVVRELPLELDAVVRVILGDRVLVKVSGVDARLGGRATLTMNSLSNITAQGEIKVEQGSYSAYGVKLSITRGSLLFAGGPVDRPTLDLLALRTVGTGEDEVKAGIQVSGTPRRPQVKLYSDPVMPDTDILAYVVLGRPLGQEGGQTDLLMLAAGGLLSKGDSAVLQDKLKNTLGLDVIDVQTGGGDVAGSMITIGKYLTPDLFISFGQSLFTNTSQARLRYNISRRWELESVLGEESGADLYYKIEFE